MFYAKTVSLLHFQHPGLIDNLLKGKGLPGHPQSKLVSIVVGGVPVAGDHFGPILGLGPI